MDAPGAQRVIESLRKGIPPDGHVRQFTVGRKSEIEQLESCLRTGDPSALLLKANYGSGKTHLLRFVRESALEEGSAVSYITLDARSAVRFNRMDQIFGAVIRNIELPGYSGKGPSALFSAVLHAMTSPCPDAKRRARLAELSSVGRWDYSKALKSPALFVGLRAWIICAKHREFTNLIPIPREVEAWLCEPWNYYTQTKWLYERFVRGLRIYFRDPRADWQFYKRGVDTFILRSSDYQQAWDALADLDLLVKLTGLRGLVLLVDEFEDVIYNLRAGRVDAQIAAFWNLFRLFDGDFPGFSFYAVTPDFVEKCKELLLGKDYWDYDYSRFDALPTFAMSPLREEELEQLAERILEAHGIAYGWAPGRALGPSQLSALVREAASVRLEDRSRYTIREVVKALDACLEESA